jgi:hypothetical protein
MAELSQMFIPSIFVGQSSRLGEELIGFEMGAAFN